MTGVSGSVHFPETEFAASDLQFFTVKGEVADLEFARDGGKILGASDERLKPGQQFIKVERLGHVVVGVGGGRGLAIWTKQGSQRADPGKLATRRV